MNKFSLLSEAWIPTIGERNKCSIYDIFKNKNISRIGGSSIHKISILKLLLAIGQAAWTPKDSIEWKNTRIEEFSNMVLQYLEKNKALFFLYGEKPFLQYPRLKNNVKYKNCSTFVPYVATGNTTVLFKNQLGEKSISDDQKVLILLSQLNFPFGGKQVDNSFSFSDNFKKKTGGKSGSSLGYLGYLHSFFLADSVLETIYINLMTEKDLSKIGLLNNGLGIPPWEKMPKKEIGEESEYYTHSYFGTLIALNRFCLFNEDNSNILITEGIIPDGDYKNGVIDLSCTVIGTEKKPQAIWCNPSKKPWRQLTALLAFIDVTKQNQRSPTPQLEYVLERLKIRGKSTYSIWSGGVKVTSNAGEQYLSGKDDEIDSEIQIDINWLGSTEFRNFRREMDTLEQISKILYLSIKRYYKTLNSSSLGDSISSKVISEFWNELESFSSEIIDIYFSDDILEQNKLRSKIIRVANNCFDSNCAKETARQLEAYIQSYPNYSKFIN
jgi:CRISPR system Cascade subunit CasA